MGRPYSRIRKADELKAALTAYETWSKLDNAAKSQKYQDKIKATTNLKTARNNVIAYLVPFGVSDTKKVAVECIVPDGSGATATTGKTETANPLITDLRAVIVAGDRSKYVASNPITGGWTVMGANIVKQTKLAKVSLVEIGNAVDSADAKKSRITGRVYTYRKRNAVSLPFGQSDAVAEYFTAKQNIKSALISTTAKRATYFKPQGDLDITLTATT
jgi:hypothetical protein